MTGFAALDPLLPATIDAGGGERLTAPVSGGQTQAVLYPARHEGWAALWRASLTWELTPLSASTGPEGMSALLTALRRRLGTEEHGPDSACAVTWPARDLPTATALREHGLSPAMVLAVRGPTPAPEPDPEVVVRRATDADLAELLKLWLAELRYSALVGPATPRPGAAGMLEDRLRRALWAGEPVWLAEVEGVTRGMAACGWPAPARLLPAGRWGYVGTVSVAPQARGSGIGRALMAMAHRELLARPAKGTFLFYSPHNALSSVFWHRQGYRPLWTTWEVRPANALR